MAMALVERLRGPRGRRLVRYSLVSVVAVICNQSTLFALQLLDWTPKSAAIAANVVATVPSYVLNRRWAWGKTGKSHWGKEVLPFWVLSFVGLVLSTWSADAAGTAAAHFDKVVRALIVNGASLAAFGVLWVGKFLIFERFLFGQRSKPEAETDDG